MQVVVDFVEDSCRVSLSEVTLNGTEIFSTARATLTPHQRDQQEPAARAPDHHLESGDPSLLDDEGDQRIETVTAQEEEAVQDEDEEAMGGKVKLKFCHPVTLAAKVEVQYSEDDIVEDQEDWKELPPKEGQGKEAAPSPPAMDASADAEMVPIPPEDATEEEAQVMQEVAAALEEEVPGEGLADAAHSGLDDQVPHEESIPVADAYGGDNEGAATPSEAPVEGHARQPRWSEAEERGSEGNGEEAALETLVEEGEEAEDQVAVEEGAPVSEEVPEAESEGEGETVA
jgi:hypothetical protein